MQIPGENLMIGRGNPFQLLVALSSSGNANGNLYWDDGDSIGIFQLILFYSSLRIVYFRFNTNFNI